MKRLGVLLGVLGLLVTFMACKSQPAAEDQRPPEEGGTTGSFTISQEMYDFTLAEVKVFVDSVNSMIARKDYESWKAALSDEFFARISSPDFLAKASEAAALKSRKIVLKTPQDYFLQVVVPSRANSKVDEIEFIAADRVKVFFLEERVRKSDNTSTSEIRRLRLYELIKIDNTWKIID